MSCTHALEHEADGLRGAVAEEDIVNVGREAVAPLEEVRELLPHDRQALGVAVRADAACRAWVWDDTDMVWLDVGSKSMGFVCHSTRTGDGREVGARAGDGVAGEELVHVRVVQQEGRAVGWGGVGPGGIELEGNRCESAYVYVG